MSRLHLIERDDRFRRVDGDVWESGFWDISPERAAKLVGSPIYFHKRQDEESFFGGEILSFRVQSDGDCAQRIIFRFRYAHAYRGIKSGDGGWSYEKKIVIEEEIKKAYQLDLIEKEVKIRKIENLLHFTRVNNLPQILQHGLLTRKELEKRKLKYIPNDVNRIDKALDASCLSISFPNYLMFYKYRCINSTDEWVIIAFNPSILFEYDCAFCVENAASAVVFNTPIEKRKGYQAFKKLFDDRPPDYDRASRNLPDCFPTHPQAEVLVFGNIPSEEIQCLFFLSEAAAKVSSDRYKPIICKANNNLFTYRIDIGHEKIETQVSDKDEIPF